MARRAVILDLDGTIWDSRPWYAAVAGRGDPDIAGEALAQMEAGTPAATVLKGAGFSQAGFRAVCQSDQPPLQCFIGILEALHDLRDKGVELAAATNLPGWMALPMAEACGVPPLLTTIVAWGDTTRHKPRPEPLLEASARLKSDPRLTWYVGDQASDAAAAQAGGMPFAWASWGTDNAPPEGASTILERPADLANLPWPAGSAAVA